MKWLLIGDSNVSNNANAFISTDPEVQKEREIVKCTSYINFKLQVQI